VTLEDLLEELVGEIRDEFDEEERLIQKVGPHSFRVSGKLAIDDLNAAAGLNISNASFDTVGGWVLDLFGRVPHRGEKKAVGDVMVAVEKIQRTRVVEVLVTLGDAARTGEAA
jgi:putative hemolysin